MDSNFSHIGVRIISKLRQLGLKQADLCRETGISSNAISQYCTGKRVPDTASLYKISGVLKTSMEWILTGGHPSNESTSTESMICDGVPLSEAETDLVAMYRLLPEQHKEEVFELVHFKYKRIVEDKGGSIYSTYTEESKQQKSSPADGSNTDHETA